MVRYLIAAQLITTAEGKISNHLSTKEIHMFSVACAYKYNTSTVEKYLPASFPILLKHLIKGST